MTIGATTRVGLAAEPRRGRHNLKIAWNLMRIHHAPANERYVAIRREDRRGDAEVGMDRQRGGWYDVMERELGRARTSTATSGTTARRGGSRNRRFSPT